ncbi:hypothetical protein, partial [Escherichia coli]|uniref:hypothetical protein n=1 Tax=Escherichia coli TaxID=562 RepID=UPI001BAF22C0
MIWQPEFTDKILSRKPGAVHDDEGYPEIARCTEREFATILAGISAGGMYCPECGTVHWPDGVPP